MVLRNGHKGDKMEISIPCKPEYVRTVRRAVAEFAETVNLPNSAIEEIKIAASEAVANVIRHAYPGYAQIPPVKIECANNGNKLTVDVLDEGCGFDAPDDNVIPEVDIDRDGGLGIIFIKSLMDSVNYVSCTQVGTRIRMVKRAARGARHLKRHKSMA